MARWLCTIEPSYRLTEVNGRIIGYKIVDHITDLLTELDDNYDGVLHNLSIRTITKHVDSDCIICLEPHNPIIQLPCEHTYCLDSLLNYYALNRQSQCMYCAKVFRFDQCINCV